MRLTYLFNRLKFRISVDSFIASLKELVYFNREVVLVQIDLSSYNISDFAKDLQYTIIDSNNSKEIEEKYKLPLFDYYAQNNCKTLITEKENNLIGFIRWTEDKNFRDLQRFGILLKSAEAYMFDFFIFPEYRGTSFQKDISNFVRNHLKSEGINKYYGFFFSDNLPALWWHRTVLRAEEFKRLKVHKLIFFEWINGKLFR